MEPMTLSKAKEITNTWPINEEQSTGVFVIRDSFFKAKGFILGWDARGKEVDRLRTVLENIKNVTPKKGAVNEWCREALKLANSK